MSPRKPNHPPIPRKHFAVLNRDVPEWNLPKCHILPIVAPGEVEGWYTVRFRGRDGKLRLGALHESEFEMVPRTFPPRR